MGFTCADVSGGFVTAQTKVQAWDCHAAPNQQFEWNGYAIYFTAAAVQAMCLDITGGGTARLTPVQIYPCHGGPNQAWEYLGGQIFNPNSQKCLNAGNFANGTQLAIEQCDFASYWQIK